MKSPVVHVLAKQVSLGQSFRGLVTEMSHTYWRNPSKMGESYQCRHTGRHTVVLQKLLGETRKVYKGSSINGLQL